MLGELVDVVGIFHLIIYINDVLRGESHAQTDSCRSPSLRHGLKDDEVGVGGELLTEGKLLSEVDVGFVDNNDTLEALDDLQDFVAIERVACRIVGRADPDDLGVVVAGCQQLVGMHLVVVVKQHLTKLDVVDVGTDLIHAVGRGDGYHVVATGIAEHAISEVDGLVTAVAQEYVFLGYTLDLLQGTFQFALQRVGIAVVRLVIGILVGIKKDVSLLAGILVASGRVGCETPDVLSDQLF